MSDPFTGNPFISFVEIDNPGRKTRKWQVISAIGGDVLGEIQWYSPWRRYVLLTKNNPIFDTNCMTAILEFINSQMTYYREEKTL